MSSNRVLTIRVSGKDRKEKVRKLLLDLAHFKNLLIMRVLKSLHIRALMHQKVSLMI
jgi:putative transposase